MIANRSILLNKKYATPPHPPSPRKINVKILLLACVQFISVNHIVLSVVGAEVWCALF